MHKWKRPMDLIAPPKDPSINEELEACGENNCSDYRGEQTKTIYGKTCVPWQSKSWSRKSKYANSGLDGNQCRNPDGSRQLWCFTNPEEGSNSY
jgi:hypothetical protein